MEGEIKPFNIGDIVYSANARWSNELVKCPVCDGTRWVFVKPFGSPDSCGNRVLCDYCTKYDGWSSHSGQVADQWRYVPIVQMLRIDGVVKSETSDGTLVTYQCNKSESCWQSIDHGNVFERIEDARKAAEIMAKELSEKSVDRKTVTASGSLKSAAWRLGYHRQGIKSAVKDFKYHAGQIGKLRKTRSAK